MEEVSALPCSENDYVRVMSTPKVTSMTLHLEDDDHMTIRPRWVLYANVLVSLLQALQLGWSTTQLNFTTFNDEKECNARPIAAGTCLMFPGHSQIQWTIAVSAWIVGGMIGAFISSQLSNKFGRKLLMMTNCVFMITGSVVQASALSIGTFIVGRVISGIASGGATGVIPNFINEISPPHLRNSLGAGCQIAITVGNLLVAVIVVVADTSSGWRYVAGFPVVLASLYLVLAPFIVVESPVWLMMEGRPQQAEKELIRLFGDENVFVAMTWIVQDCPTLLASRCQCSASTIEYIEFALLETPEPCNISKLFSPLLFRQLVLAVGVAAMQQLTGINAIFFYSSTMFEKAGVVDDRIGIVVVNTINMLSSMLSGTLAQRLGNRRLILYGLAGMFFSGVGITAALIVQSPTLAIVFTSCYVAAFTSSLGSLAWMVMVDLFPADVRSAGMSICVSCCWLCNLAVGISFPYVASTLSDWSFTPFLLSTALAFIFTSTSISDTSNTTPSDLQLEFSI